VEVAAERPRFRGEGATAMFEVQIMSDLHLEFANTLAHLPSFEPRAPYLVPLPNHLSFRYFLLLKFFFFLFNFYRGGRPQALLGVRSNYHCTQQFKRTHPHHRTRTRTTAHAPHHRTRTRTTVD
jgi:hypothetical protein